MNTRLLSLSCVALLAAGFPAAQAEGKDVLKAGALSFQYAEPWENVSSGRPMRAGELRFKQSEEGLEDVDVIFFYFGQGQGGGIEANIERWIGMFEGEPKVERETDEIDGSKIHFLYASGTYLDGGAGGPFGGEKTARPGYTMLAAIVENEQGAVFLRLTGPEKSAAAAKEAFKALAISPFQE